MVILDLWGINFHPAVVVGLGNDLLFNSILAHCVIRMDFFFFFLRKFSQLQVFSPTNEKKVQTPCFFTYINGNNVPTQRYFNSTLFRDQSSHFLHFLFNDLAANSTYWKGKLWLSYSRYGRVLQTSETRFLYVFL